MKKSIISASIAAMVGSIGLVGMANAAVLVPPAGAATGLVPATNGIGHILFVPYFTTQGTNATLLNIINTDTTNAKAVKVRFRGASNSDDLLDFTLLMSPGDVWAAKVSQNAAGLSVLETSDKTCVLPASVGTGTGTPFGTSRLNPALNATQLANETREGYVEILAMADIPRRATADQAFAAVTGVTAGVTGNVMWEAVKHTATGGAPTCATAVLNQLQTDPTTFSNVAGTPAQAAATAQGKGLTFPTGGLMANYTIIDTKNTSTYSGEAVALLANNTNVVFDNGIGNLVFFPQVGATFNASVVGTGVNVVTASNIDALTADPLLTTASIRTLVGGVGPVTPVGAQTGSLVTPLFVDLPDLSTPYVATGAATGAAVTPVFQAAALSDTLSARATINEVLTTTSIAATTDWVFSMPTRRYNVAMNYAFANPLGGDGRVYTDFGTGRNYFTSNNTSVSAGRICVAADSLVQRDREEQEILGGFVVSPATVQVVRFCGETSVLALNNGTKELSGSLAASLAKDNINLSFNEGWLTIAHRGLDRVARGAGLWPDPVATGLVAPATLGSAADTGRGLPVIGAAYAKSTSFGAAWRHRFVR